MDVETGLRPEQIPAALDRLGDELRDAIPFYDPGDRPYGFLPNFSAHPILTGETVWPSAEHFYQASKFADPLKREAIRMARTPHAAKRIGHRQALLPVPDWERRKEACMREILAAKFRAHPLLRAALIATGDRERVEGLPRERFRFSLALKVNRGAIPARKTQSRRTPCLPSPPYPSSSPCS